MGIVTLAESQDSQNQWTVHCVGRKKKKLFQSGVQHSFFLSAEELIETIGCGLAKGGRGLYSGQDTPSP